MEKGKTGELEFLGWAPPDITSFGEATDNLNDLDLEDVSAIVPIYRGHSQYAARYGVDDGNGEFGGYDYEIMPTELEAKKFLESLRNEPAEIAE